jgi:hypothetical protein
VNRDTVGHSSRRVLAASRCPAITGARVAWRVSLWDWYSNYPSRRHRHPGAEAYRLAPKSIASFIARILSHFFSSLANNRLLKKFNLMSKMSSIEQLENDPKQDNRLFAKLLKKWESIRAIKEAMDLGARR